MYNRDGITIQAEVTVTHDDIKDALNFSEIMDIYEPTFEDVMDRFDFDSVLEWITQQGEFTKPDTMRALCDDDDFCHAVIEEIGNRKPEFLESAPAQEPPVVTFESYPDTGVEIVKAFTPTENRVVGSLTTLKDGQVLVSCSETPGAPVVRFQCDSAGVAKTIILCLVLQNKVTVQS